MDKMEKNIFITGALVGSGIALLVYSAAFIVISKVEKKKCKCKELADEVGIEKPKPINLPKVDNPAEGELQVQKETIPTRKVQGAYDFLISKNIEIPDSIRTATDITDEEKNVKLYQFAISQGFIG